MRHVSTGSVKDDVMSAVHFTEGGEFRPTLVIGLGGSGVETARRLKRILNQRYKMNNLISFLFMDTDEGVYTENGELANVEEFERASVAVRNPEQLVEEFRKNPKLHPYFHEFLDDSIDVVILKNAIGAAGIRPVGRFAFHASFDTIYPNYVDPAIKHIMGVHTLAKAMMLTAAQEVKVTHSHPRIYVISSLCGGTGSGIFLDTAIVVRHLMEQNNLDGEIVGIFYLPSVFSHESGISSTLMEVIEANAYAGLMELEYFCNPQHIQKERWTFTYPMIGTLTLKEPLFDEVFLVEGTNASGQGVTSKRDAFEMVARSLMLDIGSPLGARTRSAKRNSIAVIETIPCAETGEPRIMNSLAVTNLSIPIEELTRYCAARAAIEAWFERDGHHASNNLPQQVEAFLKAHDLDVSENSNSLLEHLLTFDNSLLHYSPPRKQDLLNEAESAGHKKWEDKLNYVAQRLEEEFDRVRNKWLPEQVTTLKEKAVEHLQKALDAAGTRAEEILNSNGHEATSAFLEQLAAVIDEVQKALTARIKNKEEAISKSEQDFRLLCQRLKEIKVGWPGKAGLTAIVGPPSEVTFIDAAIDQLRTFANESLYRLVASAALEALGQQGDGEQGSLTTRLRGWARLVQNWQTHNRKTVEKLKEWASDIVADKREHGYTLEWLAMLRRDFEGFYSQLSIPYDQIREKIAKYRSQMEHEPAFGSLSTTRLNAEEDAQLCLRAAAEVLSPQLREKANVLEVVLQNKDKETSRAEYLKRKLDLLFDVCQPFWTTSHPPGEPRFETLMAVSMPITKNGAHAENKNADDLRESVRQLCEQYGYRPEIVKDGYPFALTVMCRTYGARAYYLKSANRMRHFYQRRVQDPKVKARLHLDKRFYGKIPLLHPADMQPTIEELWSWAVAYGYIVQQGEVYYIGVYETPSGDIVPKYETEWQIALTANLPSEWKDWCQKRALSEDRLGDTREAAYRAFLAEREHLDNLASARTKLEKMLGRENIAAQLEEYTKNLLRFINDTESEEHRKLLNTELEALNRYIKRLRNTS